MPDVKQPALLTANEARQIHEALHVVESPYVRIEDNLYRVGLLKGGTKRMITYQDVAFVAEDAGRTSVQLFKLNATSNRWVANFGTLENGDIKRRNLVVI